MGHLRIETDEEGQTEPVPERWLPEADWVVSLYCALLTSGTCVLGWAVTGLLHARG